MSDHPSGEASEEPGARSTSPGARWGEINDELHRLKDRTDPESRARFEELIDELMCVDMSLQPYRKAMGRKQG